MAYVTPSMGLTVWNLLDDKFDHTALAANFAALDGADHSPGKGVPIPTAGLAAGAVTTAKIAAGAVTTAKIAANAGILGSQLSATAAILASQLGGLFTVVSGTGDITATPNQFVFAFGGGSQNIFLPASPSAGATVAVFSTNNTPTSPDTINGNGHNIYALGARNVATMVLGTDSAAVVLVFDGTRWDVIAGRQDTGWLSFTNFDAGNGVVAHFGAGARQLGDQVLLRGNLGSTSPVPFANSWAKVPAGLWPSTEKDYAVPLFVDGTDVTDLLTINTDGTIITHTVGASGGMGVYLDGVSWTLS